jgi:hypothetical protein
LEIGDLRKSRKYNSLLNLLIKLKIESPEEKGEMKGEGRREVHRRNGVFISHNFKKPVQVMVILYKYNHRHT